MPKYNNNQQKVHEYLKRNARQKSIVLEVEVVGGILFCCSAQSQFWDIPLNARQKPIALCHRLIVFAC
jgi:hypothetical protein